MSLFTLLRCWLGLMLGGFLPGFLHAQPNIVFILADDLGYGDLACYGHPIIQSPHLDQLAQESIRFTHAYSASPLCSPSRAGMLTGRTPFRTGIESWIPEGQDIFLRKEELTLSRWLQEQGYQTFLSGKWHLNGGLDDRSHPQPQDHGFDHWTALHAFPIPHQFQTGNFYRDGKPIGPIEGYSAEFVVDEALKYLEGRDSEQPFFLYLAMVEPHSEIASPPHWLEKYADYTEGEVDLDSLTLRGPGEYYANISWLDEQVGRVLAYLHNSGLDKETIVIFTSDNGPVNEEWRYPWEVNLYGSTGGLRGRKADLFEGGLRVPAMIRYPGQLAAGTTSALPLNGCDWFPTLAGLLGQELPASLNLDGEDLSANFLRGQEKRSTPLFWAFHTRAFDDPAGYSYAIRSGDWKLLTDSTFQQTLLYHLAQDPHEVRDLSRIHPDTTAHLLQFIRQTVSSIESDPLKP